MITPALFHRCKYYTNAGERLYDERQRAVIEWLSTSRSEISNRNSSSLVRGNRISNHSVDPPLVSMRSQNKFSIFLFSAIDGNFFLDSESRKWNMSIRGVFTYWRKWMKKIERRVHDFSTKDATEVESIFETGNDTQEQEERCALRYCWGVGVGTEYSTAGFWDQLSKETGVKSSMMAILFCIVIIRFVRTICFRCTDTSCREYEEGWCRIRRQRTTSRFDQ